jgi:hypothetical protein
MCVCLYFIIILSHNMCIYIYIYTLDNVFIYLLIVLFIYGGCKDSYWIWDTVSQARPEGWVNSSLEKASKPLGLTVPSMKSTLFWCMRPPASQCYFMLLPWFRKHLRKKRLHHPTCSHQNGRTRFLCDVIFSQVTWWYEDFRGHGGRVWLKHQSLEWSLKLLYGW